MDSNEFVEKLLEHIQGPARSFFQRVSDNLKEVCREFLSSDWVPEIHSDGSVSVNLGQSGAEHHTASSLAEHLNWLVQLSAAVPSVERLRPGLRNRTQFFDTLFEIKWGFYLFSRPEVTSFEFGPSVEVGTSLKSPDFSFTFQRNEYFCECKRMNALHKARSSRQLRLMQTISDDIASLDIPSTMRLEIKFVSLPRHFNGNLGQQIAAAARTALTKRFFGPITLNFTDTGEKLSICVVPKDWSLRFGGMMVAGAVIEDHTPSGPKDCRVVVAADDHRMKSAASRLIRDAYTQLPKDKPGLVFLETITDVIGEDVAREKISQEHFESIAGIIAGRSSFSVCLRPEYSALKILFP